jgi:hypothetical protein
VLHRGQTTQNGDANVRHATVIQVEVMQHSETGQVGNALVCYAVAIAWVVVLHWGRAAQVDDAAVTSVHLSVRHARISIQDGCIYG